MRHAANRAWQRGQARGEACWRGGGVGERAGTVAWASAERGEARVMERRQDHSREVSIATVGSTLRAERANRRARRKIARAAGRTMDERRTKKYSRFVLFSCSRRLCPHSAWLFDWQAFATQNFRGFAHLPNSYTVSKTLQNCHSTSNILILSPS